MTNCFLGLKHFYCLKFMLIVSHNGNPIIKKYRDKILKKLELFFESKC